MYNLFQVTQTLRSLRGLVTVTVTPLRGYATHFAIAYAIVIIGWLLYSHRTTTTTNNYTTTIDEAVCQLRQGHIETTNNNNYITIKISTQNYEHQNTSNILTADNITSNTVIKSVEELLVANIKSSVADVTSTVLDSSVNKRSNNNNEQGIGYLYWLGGLLMGYDHCHPMGLLFFGNQNIDWYILHLCYDHHNRQDDEIGVHSSQRSCSGY